MSDHNKYQYEAIPDVKPAEAVTLEQTKEKYADLDLNDEQTELLWKLDNAIENPALDITLPRVDKQDLESRGTNFLNSLLLPTIAAAITLAAAYFLSKSAETDKSYAKYLVPLFPYLNAIILFLATAIPLRQRMLDAVAPVFIHMEEEKEGIDDKMAKVGTRLNQKIDDLQLHVHKALGPIKPVLHNAQKNIEPLRNIQPDIEIPEDSDIDQAFDEMQRGVAPNIEQARQHMSLDEHIPEIFRSNTAYFWRVICPILCIALASQLILAFITDHSHLSRATLVTTANTTSTPVDFNQQRGPTRQLRGFDDTSGQFDTNFKPQYDNLENNVDGYYSYGLVRTLVVTRENADTHTHISTTKDLVSSSESDPNSNYVYTQQPTDQTASNTKSFMNRNLDQTNNGTGQYKNLVNNDANSITKRARSLKERAATFKQSTNTSTRIQHPKHSVHSYRLLYDVLWSYLMSLFQLALIYFLTSALIKAWLIERVKRRLYKEASRKMREYGISAAWEDSMKQHLNRVRSRVLLIFSVYRKLEFVLEKLSGVTESLAQVSGFISGAADNQRLQTPKNDNNNHNSFLGLFGGRKS